ncbi:MAG: tRNA guanosine(34) transglycosylase Tgt [Magnetococcales bacterium]|nr:tRNA guanosine(34) transglycosylase Tgt [Magnetococcales bacterium]
MTAFRFELLHTAPGKSRRGRCHTAHGLVETPAFMPVGTAATVKTMTPQDLEAVGAQIVLGNVYHLFLRPGHELIARLGGLHRFMNWRRPILTDSGGFQVFSLGALRTIREEGVTFRSHIDGSARFLSPEVVMAVQEALGSDIMMQFDECPPWPADRDYVARSMELSLRWGARCLAARRPDPEGGALFGIVQGGMELDLRRESAARLVEMGFDGYAIGGLSVGEPRELMAEMLAQVPDLLPANRPRYLMGVGKPEDLMAAVAAGIDLFDCVLPTRNARNGQMFIHGGVINVKQARFREDPNPPDPRCGCDTCRHYSLAYLHHLFRGREILGLRLMTLHNLFYYLTLMEDLRRAIQADRFQEFAREFYSSMTGPS